MRLNNYINEVFDTEIKFTKRKISWGIEYEFEVNKKKYNVDFEAIMDDYGNFDENAIIVTFDTFGMWRITGTGNEFQVFSGVIKCFDDYLKTNSPKYIVFDAHEPSRVKLYSKFANLFSKRYPKYKFIEKEKLHTGYMFKFERK